MNNSLPHGNRSAKDNRPDFMKRLGLLPPYSPEEVKQAYRRKARESHPDHGGSPAEFRSVQEAYKRAEEFVSFRGDRRGWIAAQVERNAVQEAIATTLRSFGATVVTETNDWMQKSFGDFALLTEGITSVSLADSPHGDRIVSLLADNSANLTRLRVLALAGCQVSDDSVLRLADLPLAELDLRGTGVTKHVLPVVGQLRSLKNIRLENTSVGILARWRVLRQLRNRRLSEAGEVGLAEVF